MRCPSCNTEEDKVLESRSTDSGSVIRRRRECLACGTRFTSYERLEQEPLRVIKRDERREPFDRGKILGGLLKACEKRPVSMEQIQAVVSEIERQVIEGGREEIRSLEIGELLMNRLKGLDEVAYIRFASVYRQFKDVHEFLNEIQSHFDQGPAQTKKTK